MLQVEGTAQRQARVWPMRGTICGQSGHSERTGGRMERRSGLTDGLKPGSTILSPGAQLMFTEDTDHAFTGMFFLATYMTHCSLMAISGAFYLSLESS